MNAIIVEDENLTLKDLTNIISNNSKKIKILDTFTNGIDVISYLNNNDIDVIFLDINIPLLDGMSLAKTISKFEKKPYIVFITAHKEYAVEAFEIHAFDYILKPYSIQRIKEVIQRIEENGIIKDILNKKDLFIKQNSIENIELKNMTMNTESKGISKIKVKENNNTTLLEFDEIYFFRAKDKFTFAYTKDKEYEINNCIAEVESQAPQKNFFRCHRLFIVNMEKIKSIDSNGISSYKLKLNDIEEEVPVGRRKIKDLKIAMNIE